MKLISDIKNVFNKILCFVGIHLWHKARLVSDGGLCCWVHATCTRCHATKYFKVFMDLRNDET